MATANAKGGSARSGPAKRRPVFSKKYWPVHVAVFEFQNNDRLNHSIELSRTFRRDNESEWETSTYLTTEDLLSASKLLSEAYSVIQARIQRHLAEKNETTDDQDGQPF